MTEFRFLNLETALDELFNYNPSQLIKNNNNKPLKDIIEYDDSYVYNIHLSGIDNENLDVELKNDLISINAKHNEIKDGKYLLRESHLGDYEMVIRIPNGIDSENITASYINGILKITMYKKNKTKKIEITY